MTAKELDSVVEQTVAAYKEPGEGWAWLAIGAYCLCLRADGKMGSDVTYQTIGRLGGFVRRRSQVVIGDKVRDRLGMVAKELSRLGIPHTPDRADELKKRLCAL